MKFYQRKLFWVIFVFVFTIVLARHFKITIHDGGYGRGWYFGDDYSARNVESAAHFYSDSGFIKHCGLPLYGYMDGRDNDEVYTHYPPMSEWIAGIFSKITGKWQGEYISILPLLLSFFLFFIIYKFMEELIENKKVSFISSSFIVLSVYFIAYADDIHQHLYNELFRWLFVYCWWRYLKFDTSKLNLILLAFLYLMMCLISFEPYVFMAIITVGFSIVLKNKWISWEIVFLLSIPILAFAIRLYINMEYLGSFAAMIDDMKGAFLHRIGESDSKELGRAMVRNDFYNLLPKTRFQRLGRFYLLPSIVIFIIGFLGIKKIKNTNKELFKIAIVLYLAAVSWILVMPQHALIHIFTLRHISIFIAIVMGFGLVEYYSIVKEHWQSKKMGWLLVDTLLISYSLVYFFMNTFYMLYIKYGICYPNLGTDNYNIIESVFF